MNESIQAEVALFNHALQDQYQIYNAILAFNRPHLKTGSVIEYLSLYPAPCFQWAGLCAILPY